MKQLQPSETLPVGLLLALTGGLLDGYSYLNRGQVFATAETGNIVLMGINLAQGQLAQALHYLLPILAFALGVLAAELLRRRFGNTRLHWRLPLLLAESAAPSFWSPACPVVPWILWPTSSSPSQAPFR